MNGSAGSWRLVCFAFVVAALALVLTLGSSVSAGAAGSSRQFRELGDLVFVFDGPPGPHTPRVAHGSIYDMTGRRRLGTETIVAQGDEEAPTGEVAVAETVTFDLDDGTFIKFVTANVGVPVSDVALNNVGQGVVTAASDQSLVRNRTQVGGTLAFTGCDNEACTVLRVNANRVWKINP